MQLRSILVLLPHVLHAFIIVLCSLCTLLSIMFYVPFMLTYASYVMCVPSLCLCLCLCFVLMLMPMLCYGLVSYYFTHVFYCLNRHHLASSESQSDPTRCGFSNFHGPSADGDFMGG